MGYRSRSGKVKEYFVCTDICYPNSVLRVWYVQIVHRPLMVLRRARSGSFRIQIRSIKRNNSSVMYNGGSGGSIGPEIDAKGDQAFQEIQYGSAGCITEYTNTKEISSIRLWGQCGELLQIVRR